jgi:hypothetical protein
MVQRFATTVAKEPVGEGWVTRFINRHQDHLITRWTSGIDRVRHDADSGLRYAKYFDLLHHTIEKYEVLPRNTYNMCQPITLIHQVHR